MALALVELILVAVADDLGPHRPLETRQKLVFSAFTR